MIQKILKINSPNSQIAHFFHLASIWIYAYTWKR